MNSNLKIVPMPISDLDNAFVIYKASLEEYIDKTFGWNEEFQRTRFFGQYQADWFHWIEVDLERVGYICYWQSDFEIHISLLIIFPEKQRHSYGRQLMLLLHDQAFRCGLKITLSSFKKNTRAIRFYENIGYKIVGSDEHFVDMVQTAPGP